MTNQGQQVQLPERVTLQLTTQDAITILGALQDAGPFKVIAPIVNNVQAQLMAQQLKPQYQGPPPGAPVPVVPVAPPPATIAQSERPFPPPVDNDHVAEGCEQFANPA